MLIYGSLHIIGCYHVITCNLRPILWLDGTPAALVLEPAKWKVCKFYRSIRTKDNVARVNHIEGWLEIRKTAIT